MAWKVSGADGIKMAVVLGTNLGLCEVRVALPLKEGKALLNVLQDAAIGFPVVSKAPLRPLEVFVTPRLSVRVQQAYYARASEWEYIRMIVICIKTSAFDVAMAHIQDELDALYPFIDELKDAINRLEERLKKEAEDAARAS